MDKDGCECIYDSVDGRRNYWYLRCITKRCKSCRVEGCPKAFNPKEGDPRDHCEWLDCKSKVYNQFCLVCGRNLCRDHIRYADSDGSAAGFIIVCPHCKEFKK